MDIPNSKLEKKNKEHGELKEQQTWKQRHDRKGQGLYIQTQRNLIETSNRDGEWVCAKTRENTG